MKLNLNKVKACLSRGAYQEAAKLILDGVEAAENIDPRLRLNLVGVLTQSGFFDVARDHLIVLVRQHPFEISLIDQLAEVELKLKTSADDARSLAAYEGYCAQRGGVNAWFNFGYYAAKLRAYERARYAYEQCIKLGGNGVEEALNNLAVLISERFDEHDYAIELIEKALVENPRYRAALMTKGNLLEQAGAIDHARSTFFAAYKNDRQDMEALGRYLAAGKLSSEEFASIDVYAKAATKHKDASILCFSLGEQYERWDDYANAKYWYSEGNRRDQRVYPGYQAAEQSRRFEQLGALNNLPIKVDDGADLIFIMGMFRSGSTLLETCLDRHESIQGLGELDLLSVGVAELWPSYPNGEVEFSQLRKLGETYINQVRAMKRDGVKYVIDKRPDNAELLPLIRAWFPRAKVIRTERDPIDNAWSVFSCQLGAKFNYSRDIEDTLDYQRQLTAYLNDFESPDESLTKVSYEALVTEPEAVLSQLLVQLELDWSDSVLTPEASARAIKTASVMQARATINRNSIGRGARFNETSD